MLGWHWLAEDRRLRFGTREVVQAGCVYRAEGPLVLCRNGVHASRRALDALHYAPGPVICRVELCGEIQHDHDKSVARERRVVWLADATRLLYEFALVWLDGRTTYAELAAAEAAAEAAAWAAAWAAAEVAAWGAAGAAARAAARAAQNTMLETMLAALAEPKG